MFKIVIVAIIMRKDEFIFGYYCSTKINDHYISIIESSKIILDHKTTRKSQHISKMHILGIV